MSNGRAARGGEIGVNGERYAGGTFLPSTKAPKRGSANRARGSRRVEVEPGVWTETIDGQCSIWGAIGAAADHAVRLANPGAPIVGIPAAVAYYDLQDLIDAYNRGERWYTP